MDIGCILLRSEVKKTTGTQPAWLPPRAVWSASAGQHEEPRLRVSERSGLLRQWVVARRHCGDHGIRYFEALHPNALGSGRKGAVVYSLLAKEIAKFRKFTVEERRVMGRIRALWSKWVFKGNCTYDLLLNVLIFDICSGLSSCHLVSFLFMHRGAISWLKSQLI